MSKDKKQRYLYIDGQAVPVRASRWRNRRFLSLLWDTRPASISTQLAAHGVSSGMEQIQPHQRHIGELAEIDENFIRNDLSALEHGEMLLRRKEIYETLHPETRAGTAQALAMNTAKGNNVSDKMTLTTKSFLESEQQKEAAGYEAEQAGLADSIQELTAALSEKKDKTANISSASRI